MIEAKITKTAKSYGSQDAYRVFDQTRETFPDLAAARAWLAGEYGKHRRRRMLVDKGAVTFHCGYVIGFRNADWSHAPVEHWLQQDWVEFRESHVLDLGKGGQ
jgi:hypothetical protein